MPQINLVHDRQLATHRNERKSRYLFFASVGVAGIAVLVFGSLTLQAEGLARDKARLSAQLSKLKPLVGQTEANEREIGALMPRVQTLEDAQKSSDKWAHILAHLAHNTPTGVWLTALRGSADDAKKPIAVTIMGKGNDQKLIADLIMRAQSLPDLENVNLKYSELQPGNDSNAIEFEFGGDLAGSDPNAVAAAAAAKTGESKT